MCYVQRQRREEWQKKVNQQALKIGRINSTPYINRAKFAGLC